MTRIRKRINITLRPDLYDYAKQHNVNLSNLLDEAVARLDVDTVQTVKPTQFEEKLYQDAKAAFIRGPEYMYIQKTSPLVTLTKDIKKEEQMDPKIASYIQNRKCLSCKEIVNCRDPCEEFKKLYEYESVKALQSPQRGAKVQESKPV